MVARGWGLFSLYIYIENFKNLLVQNHWTDFHIILQKCSFGDPLPRLFKPSGFVKKHGRQGVGLIFSILEHFKNLLVRNHWTDFHIILQKCSFGDPLPRLFKPFGFVKKHGHQGAGLIFLIYLQVSPVITRWSGCVNPDRDLGEARSKFGADWSDFINVGICMGHTYIRLEGFMNENNDISCVIYINKRMSTNVVCFVFFTPSDVLFLQYIR